MTDLYIFGFGLVVTLIVGAALAAMIVAKNRAGVDDLEPHPRHPELFRPPHARTSAGS